MEASCDSDAAPCLDRSTTPPKSIPSTTPAPRKQGRSPPRLWRICARARLGCSACRDARLASASSEPSPTSICPNERPTSSRARAHPHARAHGPGTRAVCLFVCLFVLFVCFLFDRCFISRWLFSHPPSVQSMRPRRPLCPRLGRSACARTANGAAGCDLRLRLATLFLFC